MLVLIRGAGDLATGIALRLHRAGLRVAMTDLPRPTAIRLVGLGQSTPSVLISLPTGPLDGRLSLHTPLLQQDGGLDPVLTELADVLPAHLFAMEALD